MIDFPSAPIDGQQFVAANGVVYQWAIPPGVWLATNLDPDVGHTTWSDLPVWSTSTPGVGGIIDSPDLSAYRELMVQIKNLQHNTPTTAQFLLQLSSDSVTYQTTNYAHTGQPTQQGLVFVDAVPQATQTLASIILTHFNVARETWAQISGGLRNVVGGARTAAGYHTSPVAWRNIRITNIGSPGPGPYTFSALGAITVYAKNP